MKVVKKMFYIFLAVAFFIQSCAFSYVSAQGTNGMSEPAFVKGGGYKWSSTMGPINPSSGKIIPYVLKASNEKVGDKIKWTFDLADTIVNLPILQGGFFRTSYRNGIGVKFSNNEGKSDINYTAKLSWPTDGKNTIDKAMTATNNFRAEIAPYLEGKLNVFRISDGIVNEQKISFTTDRNIGDFNFKIQYYTIGSKEKENVDIQTIDVKVIKLNEEAVEKTDLFIKIVGSGEVPNDVSLSITQVDSNGNSGRTYQSIENFQNAADNTIKFKEKIPYGTYSISLSKKGYTFTNPNTYFDVGPNNKFEFKFEKDREEPGIPSVLSDKDAEPVLYTYKDADKNKAPEGNYTATGYIPYSKHQYERFEEKYKERYTKDGFKNLTDWLNSLNQRFGTYPIDYKNPTLYKSTEPNENIRNVDTTKVTDNEVSSKTRTSDKNFYKLGYKDSVVGKWAESAETNDKYNINLTIEGKGTPKTDGVDVVFVIDNSHSMVENFENKARNKVGHFIDYNETKMYSMYNNMIGITNRLLNEKDLDGKDVRIGIVNYATMSAPVKPVSYANRDNMVDIQQSIYQVYLNNDIKEYYPNFLKPSNDAFPFERTNIYFSFLKNLELTNNREKVFGHLPVVPRGTGSDNTGNDNDQKQFPKGVNRGIKHDGMTNIAAGINQGVELLYETNKPVNERQKNRKKVLVLFTDGIPTASFRLKSIPMNKNMSFEDNLYTAEGYDISKVTPYETFGKFVNSNIVKNQLPYLISTDSVPFRTQASFNQYSSANPKIINQNQRAMYYSNVNGTSNMVFNNYQGTTAVRDYYLDKYPDMKIMGMMIGNIKEFGDEFGDGSQSGYLTPNDFFSCIDENINKSNYMTPGSKSSYMLPRAYLESLTTARPDKTKYYYNANDSNQLAESIEKIRKEIVAFEKSIVNGVVEDPTGLDFHVLENKNKKLTSQKPGEPLKDGNFILTDDSGNYLMIEDNKEMPSFDEPDNPSIFRVYNPEGNLYMDSAGNVYDASTGSTAENNQALKDEVDTLKKSYLKGVSLQYKKVSGDSDKGNIRIRNLNLGNSEEVHLQYKVQLDNKDGKFHQTNMRTTLVPKPNGKYDPNDLYATRRDFPLPSARLNTPSELPSTGGISFGASSIALITMGMMVCYYVYIKNIKRT